MLEDILLINKQVAETPLEAINRFKSLNPELTHTPLTYAGRLDPMAEGLLLVLKGSAINQKDDFLHLDKTYQASILFGLSSDSLDMLGSVETANSFTQPDKTDLDKVLKPFIGIHNWPLPVFSSKPVGGRPLFEWAKNNRLNEIAIPIQNFEIYNLSLNSFTEISWSEVYEYARETISKVQGDFRQGQILDTWSNLNSQIMSKQPIAKLDLTISCSSGTYIRSIASEIGKRLGNRKTILHKLKRLSVGDYKLET